MKLYVDPPVTVAHVIAVAAGMHCGGAAEPSAVTVQIGLIVHVFLNVITQLVAVDPVVTENVLSLPNACSPVPL